MPNGNVRIATLIPPNLSQEQNAWRTQKAFQEQLNPFEIAKQQFNRAADYLDLEPSMRRVLENAKRQFIVSIPVKMDGGDVQVFEGFRVQHNIARGPAKGGIPLSPKRDARRSQSACFVDDVEMRHGRDSYGGGKGGVICDPKSLSRMSSNGLTRPLRV
jgi:glutamate dehydrogenase (NAD(P)+)